MNKILLAHGGGGEETQKLVKDLFLKYFSNNFLDRLEDSAILEINSKIAFTTDSFTVSPIFFKGGDIGKLSVAGTVNDLAVMGAKPLFLSASFIIEEGFEMENLEKIVISMADELKKTGAKIVTGDTKVVPKGGADKIFINTAGIGAVVYDGLSASNLRESDVIIVSGTVGDHGASIIASREGIDFETDLMSDCNSVWDMVESLINSAVKIKSMRDPTRGGIAAVLNEWAETSNTEIEIYQESIPVKPQVAGICELLGFEPYVLANEGMVVIAADEKDAEKAVDVLRNHPLGRDAAIIGRVTGCGKPRVVLRTSYGSRRILEKPAGELLPRIC